MSLRQVLIIYYLIFVLCISLAISYALIMLFEVIFVVVKGFLLFVLKIESKANF